MNGIACMLSRFDGARLFCDPMDTPLGSSVHGILQPRIPEWVAMPSSRRSSNPGVAKSQMQLSD